MRFCAVAVVCVGGGLERGLSEAILLQPREQTEQLEQASRLSLEEGGCPEAGVIITDECCVQHS